MRRIRTLIERGWEIDARVVTSSFMFMAAIATGAMRMEQIKILARQSSKCLAARRN